MPQIPGNSSHYILSGISIPINRWKFCDRKIEAVKSKYSLGDCEIHTAWIARKYLEQSRIPKFETLDKAHRIYEVGKYRNAELLKLQKSGNKNLYKQTKKNFRKTDTYIHLTHNERVNLLEDLADVVGKWSFARLFCEAVDKIHFDPARARKTVDEQAFEQLVSRFEQYLQILSKSRKDPDVFGALIHDNNETVSKRHTAIMTGFHKHGTLWTKVERITETPLFVNSELTALVQIADLCAYALRRYFENNEDNLLNRIKSRMDKKNGKVVGVRHFSTPTCPCFICSQ